MNKDNRGFTLIELVVVIAIIGVMAAALGSFVTAGSSNFRSTSKNSEAQMVLQETMNYIQDVLVDTNYCVNVKQNGSLNTSGIDVSYIPTSTSLEIYKYIEDHTGSGSDGRKVNIVFHWDQGTGELTYTQQEKEVYAINGEVVDEAPNFSDVANGVNVIAKDVTNFQVDVSQVKTRGIITIYLQLNNKGLTSDMKSNITLRNKVSVNELDYNYGNFPIKKNAEITIICPKEIPSGTQTRFICQISGYVDNSKIDWQVEDSNSTGSYMQGDIFYANGEGLVKIHATAVGDIQDPKATTEVDVLIVSKS